MKTLPLYFTVPDDITAAELRDLVDNALYLEDEADQAAHYPQPPLDIVVSPYPPAERIS